MLIIKYIHPYHLPLSLLFHFIGRLKKKSCMALFLFDVKVENTVTHSTSITSEGEELKSQIGWILYRNAFSFLT